MGDDITIGVTEIVNNIEITAQPNDQIVDISVIDNADEVTLNITPTVVEINVNKGSSYARWGTIYGTLTDQTDLTNALILKADLVDGLVPAYQLPSFVDDVIEVANYAALPTIGETGKIYLTLDNNKIYRWGGTVYVEIASNQAIWGQITGTLSNQTDLQTALNTKALKTTTITPNAPLTGGGDLSANRTISINQSGVSSDGYLSSTDWNTFNNKQNQLNGTGFVRMSGTTPSYITGASTAFVKADGSLDSNVYALDSVVVKLTGNQTIRGTKTFLGNQTASTLKLILADYFNDGVVESDNGFIRLLNGSTELLNVNKNGEITSAKFIKSGGTSAEFLRADGSVASNVITGSGFTNYVPYFTSSGVLGGTPIIYNGTNIFVNSGLSIGSSPPATPTDGLSVQGDLRTYGDVGIGVVPETWSANYSVLQLGTFTSLYDNTSSTILGFNVYNNTTNKYINSGSLSMRYIINGSGHIWETAPSGTADANITYTERMRINTDGNVGIGTTSPTNKLHIVGDSFTNSRLVLQRTSGAIGKYTLGVQNESGQFGIADESSGTSVDRFVIGPTGNVGIGISTPVLKIDIIGEGGAFPATSGTSQTGALRLGQDGSNVCADFGSNGSSGAWLQVTNKTNLAQVFPLLLNPNGGNVGIGTTTPASIVPGTNLTINGTSGGYASLFLQYNNVDKAFFSATSTDLIIGSAGASTNSSFYSGGSERMRINSTGTVKINNLGTGTVYSNAGILTNTNPSDERLKENITDLGYGLNEILQLRPVSYSWINDTANQGKQFGFIAQEVQEIMPDLISEFETKDGEEDVVRLGLDKEAIFVAMVNAIKEQNEVLEQLKAEIELLKAK